VEKAQLALCDAGVAELALEYTTAHDEELVEAALRLLVALLDGGTREVQEKLLKMLHATHDGRVFLRLRKLMVTRRALSNERVTAHASHTILACTSGPASRAQEESVESIKEVRSILASVKREEEKRKRVCSINSYCAGCPLRMFDDRRGERMPFHCHDRSCTLTPSMERSKQRRWCRRAHPQRRARLTTTVSLCT